MNKNENENDISKIERLRNFVEEYAVDFLRMGTKKAIIDSLDNNDLKLACEILDCMDKDFIKRTKEIGMFLVFEDYEGINKKGERITKPYYKANYIDSREYEQENIPTLRYVKAKNRALIDDFRDER